MIRVAFVIGDYPPEQFKLRAETATAYSSPDVEVGILRVPARPLSAEVSAELREVRAGGFAFDSVRAELEHAGGLGAGEGRVDVALYQDRERDYRLNSEFTLALDRKEVRIRDLTMRFDSTGVM